jgi:hypothetical protein
MAWKALTVDVPGCIQTAGLEDAFRRDWSEYFTHEHPGAARCVRLS